MFYKRQWAMNVYSYLIFVYTPRITFQTSVRSELQSQETTTSFVSTNQQCDAICYPRFFLYPSVFRDPPRCQVIEPDGTIRELTRGDAFGVRLDRPDRVLHRGTMRTVTEDCQFVWVPQTDYCQIMSREGEAEIPEMEEGGRVVLVYETVDPNVGTGGADRIAVSSSASGVAAAPSRSLALPKTAGSIDKLSRVVTKVSSFASSSRQTAHPHSP